MKIRLLLLDVDGTLVPDNSQNVSNNVINAIASVQKYVEVSLCTARSFIEVNRIIKKCKLENSFHILESGSRVYGPGFKELYAKEINYESVKSMVSFGIKTTDGVSICANGEWKSSLGELKKEDSITSIAFDVDNGEKAEEIKKQFDKNIDNYNIVITSHWEIPTGRTILITHSDATKSKALKFIQKRLRVKKTETMSIGDMPSDLQMFRRSKMRVAMGDADAELKEAADFITKSVSEDRVAYAINELILSK